MIDYITGKPRTGKSYRAVKYIMDLYFDDKKEPPYKYIITNIGGFRFDYINDKFSALGRDNQAYKLLYKDFLQHIKHMHSLAVDGAEDEELVKYADEHKINDALIVLDEAMLYLKKLDEAMSWFFSYHGHFKVRMIIMCQHPKQIHADYKIHTEFFIHAQPQSKQLRNNVMTYKHYDNPDLRDSHHSDTIKTNPEVYKLYKSGEIDKPKKILYKYIIYGVLLISFLFGVIYTLFARLTPDVESSPIKSDTEITQKQENLSESSLVSDLINLRCDDSFCWNVSEYFEHKQITKSFFKFVVLEEKLQLKYYEIKNEIYKLIPQDKGMKKVTLASLTDFYYSIPKSVQQSYLKDLFIPVKKETNDIAVFNNALDSGESTVSNATTSALARSE